MPTNPICDTILLVVASMCNNKEDNSGEFYTLPAEAFSLLHRTFYQSAFAYEGA